MQSCIIGAKLSAYRDIDDGWGLEFAYHYQYTVSSTNSYDMVYKIIWESAL